MTATPIQKFAQWERVLWGDYTYAIVANAELVHGTWMYDVISEKTDQKHSAFQSDLSKCEQKPPQKSVMIDADYEEGKIVSWRGHQYKVVSNVFVTEKEAADLEDANDTFDMFGHHCRLRLIED